LICERGPGHDPVAMIDRDGGRDRFGAFGAFGELAGPLACPDGTAEHDTCDREQWTSVKAQLAATGPTCGAQATDAAPTANPPPPPRGCCDAGDAQGALVGTCFVALWLGRRRGGRAAREQR